MAETEETVRMLAGEVGEMKGNRKVFYGSAFRLGFVDGITSWIT